jgi:hypothetical protein
LTAAGSINVSDRIEKRITELTQAEDRLRTQLIAVQGALSVLRDLAQPEPSSDGAAAESPATETAAPAANGHDTDALAS